MQDVPGSHIGGTDGESGGPPVRWRGCLSLRFMTGAVHADPGSPMPE